MILPYVPKVLMQLAGRKHHQVDNRGPDPGPGEKSFKNLEVKKKFFSMMI